MKLNHYLKELGIKWEDLPGNYNPLLKNDSAAADPRNKLNKEGFAHREFFSLDYSLALYIYPRLCEFREKYSKYGVPGYLCYDKNGEHLDMEVASKKWNEILDKMILAFKFTLVTPEHETTEELNKIYDTISEGLHLFAEHFHSLWY